MPPTQQEIVDDNKQILPTALFRAVASMKLGIILLGLLAIVLIFATLVEAGLLAWFAPLFKSSPGIQQTLETAQGTEFANFYIYKSPWFAIFLAIICLNILAAILGRFPWKNSAGFLLLHSGILIILLGGLLNYWRGMEEHVVLVEGESTSRCTRSGWSKITVSQKILNPEKTESFEFPFQSGSTDSPKDKTLELRSIANPKLRINVIAYFRHAEMAEEWTPSSDDQAEPAIHFAMIQPEGTVSGESWLAKKPLQGAGIDNFEILRISLESMGEDILHPPAFEEKSNAENEKGVLSIHYDGRMQRIPVAPNLGKRIPLEDGKIELELSRFFANAKPHGQGQFISDGEEPKNPLVELNLYLPGEKEPLREFAFAKYPVLSWATMHEKKTPVRFWYHHPGAPAQSGVEFLQLPSGKLFCRVGVGGKYLLKGQVEDNSKIDLFDGLRLKILEYYPLAVKQYMPYAVAPSPKDKNPPGPGAIVEAEYDGEKQTVGLLRDHPIFGSRKIYLAKNDFTIGFAEDTQDLGFSLKLVKFIHEMNPGQAGDAAFLSKIEIDDKSKNIKLERDIEMNSPVTYGNYTLYQSSYKPLENDQYVSFLKVAQDPGRFWKYLGSLMICLGMAVRYSRSAWK
jgi:hypothetical protein